MFQIKTLFIAATASTFFVQCATKATSNAPSTEKITQSAAASDQESAFTYFHFLSGVMAQLDNNPHLALQHFDSALKQDPESATLRLKKAEQLVSTGKIQDAKSLLKSLRMDEPELHLLNARVASLELEMDEAIRSLDKALKIFERRGMNRQHRESSLMKVALLSDSRRYREAIHELQSFLERDPHDEIAYYFKGRIYSATFDKERSTKALKRALEIRPGFTTASKALGLQYELSGQVQEAIAIYEDALAYSSHDNALRHKLANLYLSEESYSQALTHLGILIQEQPDDPQLQMRAALIHFKLRQLDEAQELFKSLLKNERVAHDRIHFYMGALHEQKEEYSESIVQLRKISPESQYFVESQLQIARLLFEPLGQREKAIDSLSEAAKGRPYNKELYLALAGYHERQANLVEAIRVLYQATRFIEKNERLHFILGSFYDRAGDYKAGIDQMRVVLELNPNHAHALNHIGYVFAERGIHLNEAEELLQKAVQLEPNNAYIIDSLGWLYYQKGEYKRALPMLKKASELSPNEPVIMEHLADVYRKLGQHEKALDVYQRAAAIHRNQESLNEAQNANSEFEDRQKRLLEKIASLEDQQSF